MTKLQEKSPLVTLTCWSLKITRDLEPQGQRGSGVHKARKELEITNLTWKVGRPREWNSLKVDNKRYKRRLPK